MSERIAIFLKDFYLYVIAALSVALLVTSIGWYVTDNKLDKERAERKADVAAYKTAQAEAETLAIKAKAQKELEDARKAKEADDRAQYWRSQYDAALMRFQANQRKTSSANLSSASPSSQSFDGPSEGSILPEELIIPIEDAYICSENTARLMAAHEWAIEQNK